MVKRVVVRPGKLPGKFKPVMKRQVSREKSVRVPDKKGVRFTFKDPNSGKVISTVFKTREEGIEFVSALREGRPTKRVIRVGDTVVGTTETRKQLVEKKLRQALKPKEKVKEQRVQLLRQKVEKPTPTVKAKKTVRTRAFITGRIPTRAAKIRKFKQLTPKEKRALLPSTVTEFLEEKGGKRSKEQLREIKELSKPFGVQIANQILFRLKQVGKGLTNISQIQRLQKKSFKEVTSNLKAIRSLDTKIKQVKKKKTVTPSDRAELDKRLKLVRQTRVTPALGKVADLARREETKIVGTLAGITAVGGLGALPGAVGVVTNVGLTTFGGVITGLQGLQTLSDPSAKNFGDLIIYTVPTALAGVAGIRGLKGKRSKGLVNNVRKTFRKGTPKQKKVKLTKLRRELSERRDLNLKRLKTVKDKNIRRQLKTETGIIKKGIREIDGGAAGLLVAKKFSSPLHKRLFTSITKKKIPGIKRVAVPTKKFRTVAKKPRKELRKVFRERAKEVLTSKEAAKLARARRKVILEKQKIARLRQIKIERKLAQGKQIKASKIQPTKFREITLLNGRFVRKGTEGAKTFKNVKLFVFTVGKDTRYFFSRKLFLKAVKAQAKIDRPTQKGMDLLRQIARRAARERRKRVEKQAKQAASFRSAALKQAGINPLTQSIVRGSKLSSSIQGQIKVINKPVQSGKRKVNPFSPKERLKEIRKLNQADKKVQEGLKASGNKVVQLLKKPLQKLQKVKRKTSTVRKEASILKKQTDTALKSVKSVKGTALKGVQRQLQALAIAIAGVQRAAAIRAQRGKAGVFAIPKIDTKAKQTIKQKKAIQQIPKEQTITIPDQTLKNPTETQLKKVIENILVGVAGTAAIVVGGKTRGTRQTRLRGGIGSLARSLFKRFRKKRFVFLPDMYSLIFGIKAKPKQKIKLLRVGRIFTGLEARAIVRR